MSINTVLPSRTTVTPLQRGMIAVLGVLLILSICFFHFRRNGTAGVQTSDAMDMVQAARRVGSGDGFSTNVVRPLLLRYLRPNDDGSLPNTAHAPLYPVLTGIGMQVTGNAGPGQGDRIAVLVSLVFFLASLFACYRLALRLFGPTGAVLSCLLYGFAANALTFAIEPRPITLATALFTLLLSALVDLDVSGSEARAKAGKAIWAGVLFGMLFLALYSSLALLLPILVYVYLVTRRNYLMVSLFIIASLIVASPLLIRNLLVAGNPFMNTRLLELVMQTSTYPGYTLYRTVGMPQSLGEYLASGGVGEILSKMGHNLLGYFSRVPYSFGILLLPLFLVASLTRFTNPQVNRIRFLVYVLVGLHIVGLSLFLPFAEGIPILLIYLPFAAIIGTTFFLNFVRARNLPSLHARVAITAWVVIGCIPGVTQILAARATPSQPFAVFNEVGKVVPVLKEQKAVLVCDVPWEMAYRLAVPTLWLPSDSTDFRASEERLGKSAVGIVMTPTLETAFANDAKMAPWLLTYLRFTSLLRTASLLDPQAQATLLRNRVFYNYPQQVRDILINFAPQPVPEQNGARFSIFWRGAALAGQRR